jgi:RHS repeat-associated protein
MLDNVPIPVSSSAFSLEGNSGVTWRISSVTGGPTTPCSGINYYTPWSYAPPYDNGTVVHVSSATAARTDAGSTSQNNNHCGPCSNEPGMAGYSFDTMLVGLSVKDTPLVYEPPVGPRISFSIVYNQKEAFQPTNWMFSNLGPKANCSAISYVEDVGALSATARCFLAGGGSIQFTNLNTNTLAYAAQTSDASTLSIATNGYARTFTDGSREAFAYPVSGNPRRFLRTRVEDNLGNAVTYSYETLTNNGVRLLGVTDAIGQTSTFSYAQAGDPLKITSITDPFGHTAMLNYTAVGGQLLLSGITDPVGITSQLGYATNGFLNTLITPYGTTKFAYTETNGLLTLIATDPLGQSECLQYGRFINTLDVTAPTGLLIDPNAEYRNSCYWDKKAWVQGSNNVNYAQITHWAYLNGQVVDIPLFTKSPLERASFFNYPGQTGLRGEGLTLAQPSKIGRVLDDGTTQTNILVYDSVGNVTNAVDTLGRTTRCVYSTNGIDLLQVLQKNGTNNDVLAAFGYNNQHLPTFTVIAGVTNQFAYSTNGLILVTTNANGEVTTYNYDVNWYLTNITGHLPSNTLNIAYDAAGRVSALTDCQGYTVSQAYDNLNRLTNSSLPDGSSFQAVYDKLDVSLTKGRDNRWSYQTHDANRKLTDVQDTAGRIFHYEWCGCGALESITDPKGQMTFWIRDIQNRPTQKIYADLAGEAIVYENSTSRVKQTTDADGKSVNYVYNKDDTLQQVSYTGGPTTPSFTFTYDTNYNRLTKLVDGIGTHLVDYVPAGQTAAGSLKTIDGPLANDTITLGYDALERPLTLQVGSAVSAVQYDTLGRTWWSSNMLGVTTVQYVDTTQRPVLVSRPNGLFTAVTYTSIADGSRLQSMVTTNAAGTVIERHDYAYDNRSLIITQTNTIGTNFMVLNYEYDLAQQLTGATSESSDGTLHRYSYSYDKAGNRLSEQIDTTAATESPNNLNQMTSRSGGGQVRVSGYLSETGSVAIAGSMAMMLSPTDFTGSLNVGVGSNIFPVSAVDPSGNSITNWFNLTISANGLATSFSYDKAGNQLLKINSSQTLTLGWDAADRCTAITNGVNRTAIAYDGLNRWSRITEYSNATVTADRRFVWNGTALAEERDATGTNVVKRFFANGFWQQGTNYYYLTDQLGSVVGVTTQDGTIVALVAYDPYGRRAQTSGTLWVDFGYGGMFELPNGLKLATWRIYDPSTGRWLSRDPIREDGGWNLYAYCGNDPINAIDPDGLYTSVEWVGIVGEGIKSLGDSFWAMTDGALNAATKLAIWSLPTPRSWWNYSPNAFAHVGFYNPCDKDAQLSRELGGIAFEALTAVGPASIKQPNLTISRWGRPGLQSGDWVMNGPVSRENFLLTFKWDPNPTNVRIPLSKWASGQNFPDVPRTALKWPPGWEKFKGIYGQRIYKP